MPVTLRLDATSWVASLPVCCARCCRRPLVLTRTAAAIAATRTMAMKTMSVPIPTSAPVSALMLRLAFIRVGSWPGFGPLAYQSGRGGSLAERGGRGENELGGAFGAPPSWFDVCRPTQRDGGVRVVRRGRPEVRLDGVTRLRN